ncbi:MAG: UDP-glucose:undecaprenyl-phosphate glucose-1-phosphate transferase [Chloroflexi bacterium ADurb.Bin325]|nr:MAG: UDP-glucose:undecaprenyl-phosphate glucose-1-phosphate transferase [Chloroflexi bacterium ADurb.Bin325]
MRGPRLAFTLSLVLVDAAMSFLAFFIAYLIRRLTSETPIGPFGDYTLLAGIQTIALLAVFFSDKFYHRRHAALLIDEVYRIFGALTVATLITVAFIAFALRDQLEYQRSMVVLAWAASMLTISLGRVIHSRIQRALQRRNVGAERVLIVGTGEVGRMILQKVQHTPNLGYAVIGFVDSNSGAQRVMDLPVLGAIEDLPRIIEEHEIGEVIIGLPEATHEELVGIISQAEREKVSIRVFPDVFQIMASEVTISDLGGLPLLTIRDVALRGWKLTLKRGVDVILSSIFLLLTSPLMMLTALAIKLDSPGPVFFVQERMGLDAKPFKMLKFRSMRQDAEAGGPGWTTKNDPRRTRIGGFIRKTSVDELPQFINVLMGDMSLVGPRPEQPAYVEQFRQSIPRYMDRHREKAGITGWAQINGLRGDTSIAERTKYDLWYIENWSLWLDFKIILRTAFRMLLDRAAY